MISRQTTETVAPAGAGPDLVAEFLAERTVAVAGRRIRARTVFNAWRSWCREVDETSGSEPSFATAMVRHGIETSTRGGHLTFMGLALIDGEPVTPHR